jgi:four helix bundle protein
LNSKYDLEFRLIRFAATVIEIAESLPPGAAGNHLASQLARSCTSPALNYGEAQSAESRNDFIHKMKIALKELRETSCCLRIIQQKKWVSDVNLAPILDENNQLIAIFVKSIETAQKNNIANKNR